MASALRQLLEAFEGERFLPIEINRVRDVVLNLSGCAEISFQEGDTKQEVMRGMLVYYEQIPKPYAEVEPRAVIYLSQGMDDRVRRHTACKELIHILDKDMHRTATSAEVLDLIDRMSIPGDLRKFADANGQEIKDRLGEMIAIAVLFPLHLRNKLAAPYSKGDISGHDISRIAQIPERYVSFVMLDVWPSILEQLLQTYG